MHLPLPESPRDEFFIQMNAAATAREAAPAYEDPLGDVFGSDSDADLAELSSSAPHRSGSGAGVEISLDSRRLRGQHTTEGYREGITAGKAESIQAGFDEAFGLGAHIGLQCGQLLGLLEGLAAALRGRDADWARTEQLLRDAQSELGTDVVFGEAYWEANGNWKYTVAGSEEAEGNDAKSEDQQEQEFIAFEHVAAAHPVIMKWTRIVDRELRRWRVDRTLNVFLSATTPQQQQQQDTEAKAAKAETTLPPKRAIDW
ncbi:hypothetical protein F5X96DRAFT_331038 [Biscogniauxia mediterranea]|nr:hypothetical protein F5X96DRAFT_331038 [Biscogniauxia mediterranea]